MQEAFRNGIVSEVPYQHQSTKTCAHLCFSSFQEELREKLRRAESEEEKEAMIKEYSDKLAAVQDDIEQQKQKKLRDIRKLLKEERKKRKKELFKYALSFASPMMFITVKSLIL